ncbi:LysE family translocator [Naasia lichenicola]|uniref:LysE family translocator n=1 Tax=Naasia lichenicola TaxID=2565933 RepID=A0A4S4FDK5_9MICO|nr:LysE family translocator [Naasia lichenicola]THG28153.1 LysE family translocator [Naasia lichenicola]
MTVTSAILGFALVAALLTIIPGLDTALVLRSAINRGRGQAYASGLGISTGSLIWAVAAAVGATAVLAASETAYRVLTLLGAGYMVYLGVRMLVGAVRRSHHGPQPTTESTTEPALAASPWRAWTVGLLTNLLNPKVGAFYLATIPQFIPAGVSPLVMGALLGLVHVALGMTWFTLIIGATARASRFLRSPRATRIVDGVTGTVLVGFGIKLALSPR